MIEQRLYYKDFYKHRWLKNFFKILLLLIILIAGTYYGVHDIQKQMHQYNTNASIEKR